MERVDRMMGRGVIDDQFYEELEEALLQTDASVSVTQDILKKLPLVGKALDDYSLDTVKMFHDDAHAAGFSLELAARLP